MTPVGKRAVAALLYSVNAAASLWILFGGLTRWCTATGRTAHALGHDVIRQKPCFQRDGRKSSNGADETCNVKVTLPACSEKGGDGVVYSKQINTLPDVDCMNLWLM